MKKKSDREKGIRFFGIYFVIIALVLLWNLFHCTSVKWMTRDGFLFTETQGVDSETDRRQEDDSGEDSAGVELLDERSILVSVPSDQALRISGKARLRGAALLGYENTNGLLFSGEGIRAEVMKKGSAEILGEGGMLLKNQSPYPADETMVYIAFSGPVSETADEELVVRFSSEGLARNGIFFFGETQEDTETGEEGGSFSEETGSAGNVAVARLYYEKKEWHPFNSILYFLLEAGAGVFCWVLWKKRRFPLHIKREKDAGKTGQGSGASGLPDRNSGGKEKIRVIIPLMAVLALFIFTMLFTWLQSIRKASGSSSAEVLVPQSGDKEIVEIAAGQSIVQNFIPGQDMLSAAAVRISDRDSLEKESGGSDEGQAEFGSGVLIEWKLLDEEGESVLAGGSSWTGELALMGSVLGRETKSEAISEAAEKYVLLPFDTVVEDSAGRAFRLMISVPERGQGQEKEGGDSSLKLYSNTRTNGQAQGMGGLETDGPTEICLLGIYRNNGFLKEVFIRLFIVMLLLLIILFYALRMLRGRISAMYLVCALCMGMVFSFMTPAYTISDERTHIDTVYTISNRLLGLTDIPGPEKIFKRACDIDSSMQVTMPVTAARYRAAEEGLFGPAPENTMQERARGDNPDRDRTDQEKSTYPSGRQRSACFALISLENVSILCYLPAAVGFSLARILGRNMITMIMIGRWMNVLVCVLIIFFAVRRIPYGAACMAVIGLFPKTLQQIASCSYDGVVIAGTFLFISYCLAAAFDREYSVTDLLTLFLSGFFVASSKGGAYLPVLGLVLLIPFARKEMCESEEGKNDGNLIWNRITAAVLGGSAVLFLVKFFTVIFGLFTRTPGSFTYGAGESARTLYTISDFIHVPDKLLHILLNTVNVRGDGIIGELVGKNLCQRWYLVYAFIILAMLGMLRSGREDSIDNRSHIRASGRIWILLLVAASTGLVFMSMLMAFTTKGALYIEGIQGRYFLPVTPLLYLAAENVEVRRQGLEDYHILYTAAVLLALTFSQILLYYFGGI